MEQLIENTSFNTGQNLTLVGFPKPNATQFEVNIGPNKQDIALQINPRFKFQDDENIVVCNSYQGGRWGSEHLEKSFPFGRGEDSCLMTSCIITEFRSEFVVTLPDASKIQFPNRIGAEQYSVITVNGDVRITMFKIE
ncbi:beta-galactoside-binding lectin-like [Channa argus]|uniref:beta-galactoside-binding lectin-like n=1 Tax=Channa argus TaxID=215402 RepID=UPI0035210996